MLLTLEGLFNEKIFMTNMKLARLVERSIKAHKSSRTNFKINPAFIRLKMGVCGQRM